MFKLLVYEDMAKCHRINIIPYLYRSSQVTCHVLVYVNMECISQGNPHQKIVVV